MNLYFIDANGKEFLIAENVEPGSDTMANAILLDMKDRKKDFKSSYQRYWFDKDGWFWIDFDSHTEFYVCHEAGAKKKEHNCNDDYCELDL